MADHGASPIYREAFDADLRVPLSNIHNTKIIKVRWIPRHCHKKEAKSPKDLHDIQGNNRLDVLAKLGTTLPLPIYTTDSPTGMCLQGTEAPTPAKKWIGPVRAYGVFPGVH